MLVLFVLLSMFPSLVLLIISCASSRNNRKLGSDETSSKTSLTSKKSVKVPSEPGVSKILPPKRTLPPAPTQIPNEPVPTTEKTKTEPPTAVDRSMRVEQTQAFSSRLSTESLKPMEINHNDETKDDTESLKPYKLDVPSEVFMREHQEALKKSIYLAQKKASENRIKEDVTVQSETTAKEIRQVSKLTKAPKMKEHPKKISSNDGTKTAKEKVESARKKESKIKGKKHKNVSKKEKEDMKTARRIIH